MNKRGFRVGLISDTHGLLRPQALALLRGSDFILHAGDIGTPEVLEELGRIAPVTAVRGNNDTGAWARSIPETTLLEAGDLSVFLIHDIAGFDADALGKRIRVVVSGHSHKPRIDERDGVLFVNPGSAGPRRFSLPITIGELKIEGTRVSARLIELATA